LTDVHTRDEEHERRRLAETVRLLSTELERLTGSIDKSARTIDEQKAAHVDQPAGHGLPREGQLP
jgi:DNA helicase-2/ATP-dependent DNA helicase PcrA